MNSNEWRLLYECMKMNDESILVIFIQRTKYEIYQEVFITKHIHKPFFKCHVYM